MRDIQLVLERWGVWSRQREETGYSAIAAGFKGLLPESPSNPSCCDDDALVVDSCVGRLKQKRPDEHDILFDHYVKGISKRQIGRKLKCDEKMIRVQLQMAEGFIDGCLSMLNVRLEMDPFIERKNIY